jgi:hypothetical protein
MSTKPRRRRTKKVGRLEVDVGVIGRQQLREFIARVRPLLEEPLPTTRRELFALHTRVCTEARVIMREKNRTYGTAADALRNYRGNRDAGVSPPQAVFARLTDKRGRLALVARGKVPLRRDDIRDAINILIHLEALCIERGDLLS